MKNYTQGKMVRSYKYLNAFTTKLYYPYISLLTVIILTYSFTSMKVLKGEDYPQSLQLPWLRMYRNNVDDGLHRKNKINANLLKST